MIATIISINNSIMTATYYTPAQGPSSPPRRDPMEMLTAVITIWNPQLQTFPTISLHTERVVTHKCIFRGLKDESVIEMV